MLEHIECLPSALLIRTLLLLPVDARARCAILSRCFMNTACEPLLWSRLDFTDCTAKVSDATLLQLVRRSEGALRVLNINAPCCERITLLGALDALKALPHRSALEEVDVREPLEELIFEAQGYDAGQSAKRMFDASHAAFLAQLRTTTCPQLRTLAFTLITAVGSPHCAQRLARALAPPGVEASIALYVRLEPATGEANHWPVHVLPPGTCCRLPCHEQWSADGIAADMRALCATVQGAASVKQLVFYPYDTNMPEAKYNSERIGGDESLLALAQLLAANATIDTLVLNSCGVGDLEDEAIAALVDAVRGNTALRAIHLADNEQYFLEDLVAVCAARTPPVTLVFTTPNWADTGRPVREYW